MGYWTFIIVVVAIVLFIFFEGSIRSRKLKEQYRQKLLDDYGKQNTEELGADDVKRIGLYHIRYAKNDPPVFCIDDITWNDLAMDDIFTSIDTCSSSIGEEELYHRLHCPVLSGDPAYDHFCELREYFDSHEQERIRIQEILHDIGINRKTSITKIYDYVEVLKAESNFRHYIMAGLMLISIILIFIKPGPGVILFLIAMFVSIGSYLKTKKEIEPLIITFNYTAKMIRACERLKGAAPDVLSSDMELLAGFCRPLHGILNKSVWISSGSVSMDNPVMLLLEYIKMMFHIDLIIMNGLIGLVKAHISEINGMRRVLGGIDASIAAGSYKRSLISSCVPEFDDADSAVLHVKGCIHPLVKKPVANSIDTEGAVLLTGSNASGKSTFLKSIAISALLAQTLGFTTCDEYRASRFRIYTSMALNDSIRNGESYFIVEIKSIKRIIDSAAGAPVLCCIDEVLRGTNTVERIAASTQILKSLLRPGFIPFAATHDIELTHLLDGKYSNYHFEEEVNGNDIRFNYQLMEGRAESRNAIKLLGVMDYDRTLIDDAEKLVEHFMSTGNWQ